jgi:hypothetical protein
VTLWVLTRNTRARTLYEAMGWNHDGTAREYLGWGIKVPEVRYARCAKAGKKGATDSPFRDEPRAAQARTAWVISAPGSRPGPPSPRDSSPRPNSALNPTTVTQTLAFQPP